MLPALAQDNFIAEISEKSVVDSAVSAQLRGAQNVDRERNQTLDSASEVAALAAIRAAMTADERDTLLVASLTALGTQTAQGMQDSCHSGLLGMALKKMPSVWQCLGPCHSSCPAVNDVLQAYMLRGGKPAAERSVCHNKANLMCLVDHIEPCMELVGKAATYGIQIPTSRSQFSTMCP